MTKFPGYFYFLERLPAEKGHFSISSEVGAMTFSEKIISCRVRDELVFTGQASIKKTSQLFVLMGLSHNLQGHMRALTETTCETLIA